jgi:hypothetical protein
MRPGETHLFPSQYRRPPGRGTTVGTPGRRVVSSALTSPSHRFFRISRRPATSPLKLTIEQATGGRVRVGSPQPADMIYRTSGAPSRTGPGGTHPPPSSAGGRRANASVTSSRVVFSPPVRMATGEDPGVSWGLRHARLPADPPSPALRGMKLPDVVLPSITDLVRQHHSTACNGRGNGWTYSSGTETPAVSGQSGGPVCAQTLGIGRSHCVEQLLKWVVRWAWDWRSSM